MIDTGKPRLNHAVKTSVGVMIPADSAEQAADYQAQLAALGVPCEVMTYYKLSLAEFIQSGGGSFLHLLMEGTP